MTRDKARDEILSRWEEVIPEILPRAKKNVKGKPTWICPNCGHGAGGDGIVPNKKSEVHGLICFTCNWTGNIIDLYMKVNGVDYKTAFNALADRLRLDVDRYDLSRSQGAISAGKKPDGEIPTDASRTANQAAQLSSNTRIMDYNDYYMECRKRMSDTAGRKGAKLPRMNIAFAPEIYDYIQTMSRVRGETLTDFVNHVLRQSMDDYADIYKKAQEFRNSF